MTNRDEHGRFLKGHGIKSPGRPALAAELPAIEGIKAACTAEGVAQALDKLFAIGMGGNVKALVAWLSYAVGMPARIDFEERLTALESLLDHDATRMIREAAAAELAHRKMGSN